MSPVKPTGCPWFTLNGTVLAWANASAGLIVTLVPLIDWMTPVSRLSPLSTKNGWPATRFAAEATVTFVAPGAVAAPSVVIPATGTLLASSNPVPPPAYCRIGVALIFAETVDGYGFSSMFESWTPPTLKPGMPRFQKTEASSSWVDSCASTAVPAG